MATQPQPLTEELGRDLALLEKAVAIAVQAHHGQKDRYGAPYILHPLRVMSRVEKDREKIVAILHDVVEDTRWGLEELKDAGFPEDILKAIDCLTKREGEPYEQLVSRAAANPLARRVKIADLEDNLDVRRFNGVTQKDAERLAKYLSAWQVLTGRHIP